MLKNKIRFTIYFLYYYFLFTVRQFLIRLNILKAPPKPVDPIEEYIKPRKAKLLRTYETDLNLNTNIDTRIYNKKTFSELLKDEANDVERLWKTRILYESTPRGTIMMYYDIYKQGFAYYADQNGVPYSILNGMAMKYVVTFFCRDLFFDEDTITIERMPPLVKIFEDDDKPVKETGNKDKDKNTNKNENQPFAKLKNYKNVETNPNAKKTIDDKPLEKPKMKNKFISLGKMNNFSVIQRKPKQLRGISTKETSHEGLFTGKISYKDFKNRQVK